MNLIDIMLKIIFSDIDGTLAHYPAHFQNFGEIVEEDMTKLRAVYRDIESGERRECNVLASMTAGNAYVSWKTIELVRQIRAKGVKFVLISGARTSTFLKRLPYLPKADMGIAENGGRIYEDEKLDKDWANRFYEVTGDIETNIAPEERKGLLWDWYRRLKAEGWHTDARDYYANFRVDLKKSSDKTAKDMEEIIKILPREITSTYNLGKADFYPAVCGKGNAVRYILERYNLNRKEAAAMMDDDNDLPMAEAVSKVYLPGITHESVAEAVKQHPDWIVAKRKGILGVEEVLERILERI